MLKHDEERFAAAETLARRLDRPMGILGIIFLLVVLAQLLVTNEVAQAVFTWIGWGFWGVFVAEFVLRAYIARFQASFWRKNWWQVIFLLVPFLRFFRALQVLRVWRLARFGTVLSAGVRGSRSAGRLLTSRVAWLAAVTVIVILAASQLLYLFGDYPSYLLALYEAALAAITGEPLSLNTAFTRSVHVALAVYSVAIFATLAGTLGAYFLSIGRTNSPAEEAARG